jgi:hypothetical protein
MGRTFDVLQHLQRQLTAQRSGGAQLPVTKIELDAAKEKEIDSPGGKYREYPSLDRTRLRNGYQLCLRNASGLMNDATMLKEAGSLRTAYVVLLLAVEELRNAMQLYEAGCSEVQNWEEWWGRYFNHPKEQGSTSLETGEVEEADERLSRDREELLYVDFDRKDEKFLPPREGQDSELLRLFEKEALYAEGILKALPPYAFERWEFQELAQQSPGVAAPALYARIEEILSEEPAASERELLTAVALDLDMSPDDFAAGFEQWGRVSPKARTYMALLLRVQDNLKKGQEKKAAESTG